MLYSVPVKNYYGEEQRMDESREIEYLMHFGLSRQEALIYRKLLEGGKKTGYEIARDTGISRSNAYASLAAMVEKGAAYLVEGDAKTKTIVKTGTETDAYIQIESGVKEGDVVYVEG